MNREHEYKILPLDQLHPADFQPGTRATRSNVGELRKDLMKRGQLSALKVIQEDDNCYRIADGHRRKLALELNGEKFAECKIFKGVTVAEVFCSANTMKHLSTKESQKVFVQCPEALSPKQRANQLNAENFLGIDTYLDIVMEDKFAAVGVAAELKTAIRRIAVICPVLAVSMENNVQKLWKLLLKHSPNAPLRTLANIRISHEYSEKEKGKRYRAAFGLSRRTTV